ncbi:mitochondrial metalloendopeptidase OMA1-like [Papaver somniferum]|uniref:mitochondrial metalloendopeptidase OMA1-like n=1 Tax=Papaver somniferum TaxID=3469 RepID=UPI000E6FAE47|nr:mitochondrial metalloendopeptidase OMA1-like [Papaver somniferum]
MGIRKNPYSKRFHLILVSIDLEREIGEVMFNDLKKTYEGKILPETHPESVRVRSIGIEIIEALQRGLRYEKVGSGLGYSNEVQDDVMKVKRNRKKGATYHLEGLHWEILVVNEPRVNAISIPGGKIVVFTGLLDVFKTDAEIATIVAHEVGHLVARHKAEFVSKFTWLIILEVILNIGDEMSERITEAYKYLLLPSRRRNEMEADYIGLLLLASAGYDPQMAPQVYEKLGEFSGESPLDDDDSLASIRNKESRSTVPSQSYGRSPWHI